MLIELDVSDQTIYTWRNQELIDTGQLHGRITELQEQLRTAMATARTEADHVIASQTRRLARLRDERRELLQAHYADAIDVSLLKEEQDRIRRQEQETLALLDAAQVELPTLEATLDAAIRLVERCQDAYLRAGPKLRRQFNQAFFKKLYITRDDGVVRAELTDPYAALLEHDVLRHVASHLDDTPPAADPKRQNAKAAAEDEWWQRFLDGDENDTVRPQETPVRVRGSKANCLVPSAGFEPAHTAPEADALSPELRGRELKTTWEKTWPNGRRFRFPGSAGPVCRLGPDARASWRRFWRDSTWRSCVPGGGCQAAWLWTAMRSRSRARPGSGGDGDRPTRAAQGPGEPRADRHRDSPGSLRNPSDRRGIPRPAVYERHRDEFVATLRDGDVRAHRLAARPARCVGPFGAKATVCACGPPPVVTSASKSDNPHG